MKKTGEAMRQFELFAGQRPALVWLMRDAKGLLRARHFIARTIAQLLTAADGQAAVVILHLHAARA